MENLIPYQGKWIDCFNVQLITHSKNKKYIGKIQFTTPCITYYLDKEQWRELKEKINEVKV